MDTNRIEDFPSHWKTTLLGEDFWEDAERFNQLIYNSIEAGHSQTLLTRPPFSFGPGRNTQLETTIKEEEPEKKHPRRFSMSDSLSLNSFSSSTFRSLSQSRLFDFGKLSRSPSRSPARAPSVSPEARRHRSLLRTPFNMASSRRKVKTDLMLAAFTAQEPGTPARPLMHFRGGPTWRCFPKDLTALGLDVFMPVPEDQEIEETTLHIEEMAPLCQFRNLRVLKITGMMQSYQRYIWQAAWLNTNLEELELGMALEPHIRRKPGRNWMYIRGGWTLNEAHYGEPVYYGHMGEGILDPKIGAGEYLDKTALEKAKVRAMSIGRTLNRLSIQTLTLTGFVVDADPFIHWFDPKHLKCINFKDYCVDAGFYLPRPMRDVKVLFPLDKREIVSCRVVNPLQDLKVIDLSGGKKTDEMQYTGFASLRNGVSSMRSRNPFRKGAKDRDDKEKMLRGGN